MAENTAPIVMAARGLGLLADGGWLYRDVDLTVSRGTIVAIVGTSTSGRSSLVQAFAGHLKPTQGSVEIFEQGSWVNVLNAARARIALAELPRHLADDPAAQVHECVSHQLLLSGIPRSSDVFEMAAEIVGFGPGTTGAVADLTVLERRLLEIALALTAPITVVAVDAVDAGLRDDEATTLWSALRATAATGIAVIAGTTALPEGADQTIVLDTPQHSH
jgi:ABC-type branched-subunit amino acid transport system ATPase component